MLTEEKIDQVMESALASIREHKRQAAERRMKATKAKSSTPSEAICVKGGLELPTLPIPPAPTSDPSGLTDLRRAMNWRAVSGSDEELLLDLVAAIFYRDAATGLFDYSKVRSTVLMISFELNRRQTIAPIFRGVRRPPPTGMHSTVSESQLGIDRQIIDLHWLACGGDKWAVGGKPHFSNLFTAEEFDLDLADQFARTPVLFDIKAEWLSLPPTHSWQLAALKTKAMSDRERVVMDGIDSRRQIGYKPVLNILRGRAGKNEVRQLQAERQARIWACDRLAGGDVMLGMTLLANWGHDKMDRRNYVRSLKGTKKTLNRVRGRSVGHEEVTPVVTS